MARRIMHIDLDAFFVSVEQRDSPELRGKPVVVGGKPDQRGVVAAASYEARAFGLHSGMPLARAHRLCPQAVFIEGNFAKYREASEKFMSILADFSPDLEPMGLDEAYLDATGFESLYGSVYRMAARIRERVKSELGICASVGIASSKVVAKVASGQAKPDGLLEVPVGGEAAFLAPLPVGKLPGIGKKSEPVLHSLGVKTIGDLACLPTKVLKKHFGIWGELMQEHARGIDDSKVSPPEEAKSISRETTFARDTREKELILATLRYLAERVGSSLREDGKLARCVTLKLRYSDFTTITRRHTLGQATDTDQVIFSTGADLLQKTLGFGKRLIRLVGIGVADLIEGRQLGLLDARGRRQEQLDKTVDRIRRKYGFAAIQTGRTMLLKDIFPSDERGYTLHTPSLSR
ncbi:MAG: DNA polymerase IV [Chloroflexota bacterium]